MASFESSRRMYSILFNVGVLALTYYLHYTNILSYNQSYILYFGALGGFFGVDFLINPKSTVFKENQILVMLPLVLGMALLTSFLLTSTIDSNLSITILIAVDFLIVGTLSVIDWINKRKQKKSLSE